MNLEDLTPELKQKALACKRPDELLELAKSEGMELSDEQLESISGGSWGGDDGGSSEPCPHDNSECPRDWC